ncbi:MAG: AAA family ATPase [Clostridia bacterium]|nr:AAA family ATPase [Clostridia bacterium]
MEDLLTNDQQNAERMIEEWFFNTENQIFVLSGYAGTGKTFLINRVVQDVLHLKAGKEAVFVTPTGKAASVLVKRGTPAGTLHSLIYTLNEDDFDVDENGEIIERQTLSFVKKEKIDEKIRLIVVDEASMIGEDVLRDLLSFGVKCLFSGDSAQLPPVNGNSRLLENPDYALTEIVRQAADNPIVKIATLAREGKPIPYGNYDDKVCVIGRHALTKEDRKRIFLKADQIICGTNRTRNALNSEIRRYREIPEEALLPVDGEKVICTLNDRERPLDKEGKFFLVNGVIGRAENVSEGFDMLGQMDFTADFLDRSVRVPFDLGIFYEGQYAHYYGDRAVRLVDGSVVHERNYALLRRLKAVDDEPICRFEFAYAITCHKAQGSEFDFVVVFDESWAFGEEKSRWLYTAITRARERLLIIR